MPNIVHIITVFIKPSQVDEVYNYVLPLSFDVRKRKWDPGEWLVEASVRSNNAKAVFNYFKTVEIPEEKRYLAKYGQHNFSRKKNI